MKAACLRKRFTLVAAAGLILVAPLTAMTASTVSAGPTGSFTPSVVQSTECLNETGDFRWELVLSVVSTPESTWNPGLAGDLTDFTSVVPTGTQQTTESFIVTGESDTVVIGTVQFIVENIGAASQDVPVTIPAPDCTPSTTTTPEPEPEAAPAGVVAARPTFTG